MTAAFHTLHEERFNPSQVWGLGVQWSLLDTAMDFKWSAKSMIEMGKLPSKTLINHQDIVRMRKNASVVSNKKMQKSV